MPLESGIYNQLNQRNYLGELAGQVNQFTEQQNRLSQLARSNDIQDKQLAQQQELQGYQTRALARTEAAVPQQMADAKRARETKYMQDVSREIAQAPENADAILQKHAAMAQQVGINPENISWLASDLMNTPDIETRRQRALYHANPQEVEKGMIKSQFDKKQDEVFKIEQDKSGALIGVTKAGKTIPLDINGQPLIGKEKPSFSAYQAVPMIDPESGETIWGQFDKTRGGVSPVAGKIKNPIYNPNVQGSIAGAKASGKEIGQATGESAAKLQTMESQMPRLEVVASELSVLGKNATYTMVGQGTDAARRQLGMKVGEGALARKEYISKVDNEVLPLLRETFGAAFTQKEGESLKATLGDPNASPEEKDAVLKSFIETKRGQIASLSRRAGQPAPAQPGAGYDAGKEARYQAWKAQQGQ